jgi:4,5-DOPA dioxygenase extradiol
MPVLFVGHGSPMNAIEENEFSAGWRKVGSSIARPRAILCVSAHWETKGTFVTAMARPKTIHDFCGFPDQLYTVQYPAPGDTQVAFKTREQLSPAPVEFDQNWGLDHGCWSVLKHMFPEAKIPVLQLSLDYTLSPAAHYELAKNLAGLRRKGILVIGSGNMVHNLRMINWHKPDSGHDWAQETNEIFKKLILGNEHKALKDYSSLGGDIKLAVPSAEHYLPLLYTLALQEKNEPVAFFNDKVVYGSISMTSIKIN